MHSGRDRRKSLADETLPCRNWSARSIPSASIAIWHAPTSRPLLSRLEQALSPHQQTGAGSEEFDRRHNDVPRDGHGFWLEQGEGSGAAGSAQRESGGETVHPTFAHIVRPQRFANDTALVSLKDTARDAFWDICKEINQLLDGKAWTMGTQYTVCDPYAFHFYDVGSCIKLPMHELAAYAAFSKRMLERPAVCKVCGLEENILKGSNAWDGKYYAQPRRA